MVKLRHFHLEKKKLCEHFQSCSLGFFKTYRKASFVFRKQTMLSNLAKTYFVIKQMTCSTNLVKTAFVNPRVKIKMRLRRFLFMKIEKKATAGANSPLRVPVSVVLCLPVFFLFSVCFIQPKHYLFPLWRDLIKLCTSKKFKIVDFNCLNKFLIEALNSVN